MRGNPTTDEARQCRQPLGQRGLTGPSRLLDRGECSRPSRTIRMLCSVLGGARVHFWAGLLACCRIISTAPVTTQFVDSSGCSMQLTWPKVPGREGSSGRWGLHCEIDQQRDSVDSSGAIRLRPNVSAVGGTCLCPHPTVNKMASSGRQKESSVYSFNWP